VRTSTTLPLSAALPEFGARLPIFWVKELRVTLPIALGGVFCIFLAALLSEFSSGLAIFMVYPITCSAIVALAFGHDFTYRTITSALAAPISRRKIWWTRISLCAALLFSLQLINLLVFQFPMFWAMGQGRVGFGMTWYVGVFQWLQIIAVPALAALCLAPWLTLVSRSPMFGTVISLGVPFMIGFGTSLYGQGGPSMWARLNSVPLQVALVIGAILSYRRFMTLEAIDSDVSVRSRGNLIRQPSQISGLGFSIPVRRSNPIWQLVKKEFMLQRLPIGIALLAIGIVSVVSKEQAALLSIVYPAAIIILVGSIASADERRMALIPSQVSHPIRFHQQWLAKIGVSYVTAFLFGVILPVLALFFKTDELKHTVLDDILVAAPFICCGVLFLLSITIYISSFSESGIRAMLASLFIIAVSVMAIGAAYNAFAEYLWREAHLRVVFFFADGEAHQLDAINVGLHFSIATLGFIALILYFAMQNHRFLERPRRQLFHQSLGLIVYGLIALTAISWLVS
jgi:hypothetical protein